MPPHRTGGDGDHQPCDSAGGGLAADVEQGQHASFGLLNPALYRLAGTSAVNDALPLTVTTPAGYRAVACDVALCGALTLYPFDVQSFSMPGYTGQVTRATTP